MTWRDAAAVWAFVVLTVAIAAPEDDRDCPCPEPVAGYQSSLDRQGDDR